MFSSTSGYISIRDDSGRSSLSLNERSFVRDCAFSKSSRLRVDGRSPDELRQIQLHLRRDPPPSHKATLQSKDGGSASGIVQWGQTRVMATCTGTLQPPQYDDRPNEGIVSITVDLSPMASSSFGMAHPHTTTPGDSHNRSNIMSHSDETQKLLGNRILRCLERTILTGGALDTEALCVQSGVWVWKLSVAIQVLDHGGNLLDAAVLAAMASLRHFRKPHVENAESEGLPRILPTDSREPTPLPIHHTPLCLSFALLHADDVALSTLSTLQVVAFADPTEREEMIQTGALSIAMNQHGEVCLLDFTGGCELPPTNLKRCWSIAERCIRQLCLLLEQSLTEADEKVQRERLERLQWLQHHKGSSLPPIPTSDDVPSVPFWMEDTNLYVDTVTPFADASTELKEASNVVQDMEQEKYRIRALEYSQGHMAAKVKEDDESKSRKVGGAKDSTLLAAMLQSIQKIPNTSEIRPKENIRTSASNTIHLSELTKQVSEVKVNMKTPLEPLAMDIDPPRNKSKSQIMNRKGSNGDDDHDDDDEEEEAPILLKSEFDSIKSENSTVSDLSSNQLTKLIVNDDGKDKVNDDDDKDIDDLSMAIKPKSKNKKKKK
jgi:exosome complex component RRP45